ncbi:MAG: rod shape-determining protein RodA [Deltaproteobacteria bacterium]|nr:rod shape-determining protein RodA [Deltaproteobacteria bacterium]
MSLPVLPRGISTLRELGLGPSNLSGRPRDHIDWPLFVVAAIIAVLGVVNMYSATSVYFGTTRAGLAEIYINQVYWLAIGGAVGAGVSAIDYRHIERYAYLIYVAGVFSLALVFVLARDVRGASRWINIGSFSFQPSEFMKPCLIVALAKYLHDDPRSEPRTARELIVPVILTAIPGLLIAKQPDLGTALMMGLIFVSIMAITRIDRKTLVGALATVGIGGPLLWTFALPYQKARVTTFLNPAADIKGMGYHAYHARVAIGNGRALGNGYMNGMQNQYRFLPDQYTDFPFPVFAEEWGFVGAMVLLALYGFLVLWALRIASQARDRFGAVVSVGCGALIFWHAFINVGMVSGMLPVVGMPLPLFSYGGSSVLTITLCIALLMNVSMRRYSGFSALSRL